MGKRRAGGKNRPEEIRVVQSGRKIGKGGSAEVEGMIFHRGELQKSSTGKSKKKKKKKDVDGVDKTTQDWKHATKGGCLQAAGQVFNDRQQGQYGKYKKRVAIEDTATVGRRLLQNVSQER